MRATINHSDEDRRITIELRKTDDGLYFWWSAEDGEPTYISDYATFATEAEAIEGAKQLWGLPAWNLEIDTISDMIVAVCEQPGVIDDGTGGIGIIVRQALQDDPNATANDIAEIIREAQEDAAIELERDSNDRR